MKIKSIKQFYSKINKTILQENCLFIVFFKVVLDLCPRPRQYGENHRMEIAYLAYVNLTEQSGISTSDCFLFLRNVYFSFIFFLSPLFILRMAF